MSDNDEESGKIKAFPSPVSTPTTDEGDDDDDADKNKTSQQQPPPPQNSQTLLSGRRVDSKSQLCNDNHTPIVSDKNKSNNNIVHAVSTTPQVRSQAISSLLQITPSRPPPDTPTSNFNIKEPEISSGNSSASGGGGGGSQPIDIDEHLSDHSLNSRHSGSKHDDDLESLFPPDVAKKFQERIRLQQQQQQETPNTSGGGSGGRNEEDVGLVYSEAIRRRESVLEGRREDNDTATSKDVVMCIVWASGRMAAAYYDLESGQLFILPDMPDSAPVFDVMRNLFAQIHPTYVLVNRSTEERFLEVLFELTGHQITCNNNAAAGEDSLDESSINRNSEVAAAGAAANDAGERSGASVQLYLLPFRDFSLNECKHRVHSIKLPTEPKNNGPQEHMLFISSLIPMSNNDNLIKAIGCCLKFLDKSAIELFHLELSDGHVPVVDVQLVRMDEIVLVDDTAWQSLQIFNTEFHPSLLKHGAGSSASKEGLSVYSLLNQCITTQGAKKMRLMLLRPSRNKELLTRRYDTIEYCLDPNHFEFNKSATECLKLIKSIPKLLYRISMLHATVTEWKDFYQTLNNCQLLAEICSSLEVAPEFLKIIGCEQYLTTLRNVRQEMFSIIDFEKSVTVGRIVAQEGLDPDLDQKKKQYACLPEIMSIIASEEMSDLPPYVTKCCAVYIPEVGYLLAVTLWRDNLTEEEVQIPNLEYRFKTNELVYYKTPRMKELDIIFGDCSVFILEKETYLMVQLTEQILEHTSTLYKINDVVSELDCLISMANIARSFNFVRPELTTSSSKLKIKDGRHPLSDMIREFVPNSTYFKSPERVVIITGPNASGKSVYLKQVGVIVIMALCGSFVPAKSARIPLYDKICTRIHAKESVSTGFSTFMIDINQMALSLRTSTKDSLVIIDEFGKGTAEADGLSILVASIQDFIDRGEDCPTVFVSTHYFAVINVLNKSPVLKLQTMKFVEEDDTITYLFELVNGYCNKSFAQLVAKANGMEDKVLERAFKVEKVTRGEEPPSSLQVPKTDVQISRENLFISIADDFLNLDLSQVNPVAYLESVKRTVDAWRSKHGK